MRKIFTLSLSILLASCLSETSVDPGSATTFIRYFNGGNNDEAKALELAPDGGFLLAATTRIQKAEADIPRTKIKLIKTDANGNPLWQRLYPGFTNTDRDYVASALQTTPSGGYIVIGDVIQQPVGVSKSFILEVDENGVPLDSMDLEFTPGTAEKGKAIAVAANGNFLALSTQGTQTMILTEITNNSSPMSVVGAVSYTGGSTTLASRLLVDDAGKAVWSGMATASGLTGIRLLRTVPNSPTVDFDLLLSEPGYSLAGFDICRYGQGYAIAGATNKKPDNSVSITTDILYYLTSKDGNVINTTSFSFDDPTTSEDEDKQSDAGNSIAATQDSGLIFLSSVSSEAIAGRGESDFYLIKIDAFGNKEWTSSFGSRFKDEGVAIRQIADGSYVALGTTTQGSLKILTLFKTNSSGKIE